MRREKKGYDSGAKSQEPGAISQLETVRVRHKWAWLQELRGQAIYGVVFIRIPYRSG